MAMSKKRILIVAGEASADRYGARLVRRLNALHGAGSLSFYGTGGDEMQEAGVDLSCHIRDLAHIGVREALSGLRTYYKTYPQPDKGYRPAPSGPGRASGFPGFQSEAGKKNETHGHQGCLLYQPANLGVAKRAHTTYTGVCGQDAGDPPIRGRLLSRPGSGCGICGASAPGGFQSDRNRRIIFEQTWDLIRRARRWQSFREADARKLTTSCRLVLRASIASSQ